MPKLLWEVEAPFHLTASCRPIRCHDRAGQEHREKARAGGDRQNIVLCTSDRSFATRVPRYVFGDRNTMLDMSSRYLPI